MTRLTRPRPLPRTAALTLVAALLLPCLIYLPVATQAQTPDDKRVAAQKLFDEADALFDEGTAESFRAALEKFEAASRLFHQVDDKGHEAMSFAAMGFITSKLGDNNAALKHYGEVLSLWRAVENKEMEAETLTSIGAVYAALGDNQEGLKYLKLALPLYHTIGHWMGEGRTLNTIGRVYSDGGNRHEALKYFNLALSLYRANDDRRGEGVALTNIGAVYSDLRETQEALKYFKRALPLHRVVGNRWGEASTLSNIGKAYSDLSNNQEALKYLKMALSLERALEDRAGQVVTLNNIGKAYNSLRNNKEALKHFRLALPIARAVGNRGSEAATLSNIGAVYNELGDGREAIRHYNLALPLSRAAGDREGQAIIYNNLMWAWSALHNPHLAVFYGKQAVNVYQGLRSDIKSLDEGLQHTYLKSVEDAYRLLAGLLISQGRLPEAEQVLAMLKEEEYSGLLRRRGDTLSDIGYSPTEAAAIRILAQLADLGRERGELAARRDRKELDAVGTTRLNEIDRELMPKANAAFNRALEAVGREAPGTATKTAEVKDAQALAGKLGKMGPGTVALYTIVSTEEGQSRKGWVMLITPDFRKAFEMDVAGLEQTVLGLRAALRTPAADPRPAAHKLYQMIFRTPQPKRLPTLEEELEAYLKNQKARTLMWSLDGVLRYVPMAALSPDGEHYLVERYRNVVFTPASIPTLSDPVSRDWRALGLGVSKEYKPFGELRGVPMELAAIIREEGKQSGVLPGVAKLNEQFTQGAMFDGLGEGFPVIHIATHFRYESADPQKSFLLLGDGGHLEMSTFNDAAQIFEKTELLTLSACDTAMGSSRDANGKDVEGLGFVAQKLGAQSVIASLWPVDDIGTQVLMPEFYRLHEQGMPKAEAMREAQLALLRGTLKAEAGAGVARDVKSGDDERGEFRPDPKAPYAHPYYWAPFILIGNWQ